MDEAKKKLLLEKYRSIEGTHCIAKGLAEVMINTSNLFEEDIYDECVFFGLDCAIDFVYRRMGKDRNPPFFVGGRNFEWIKDFSEVTGISYKRNIQDEPKKAWMEIKAVMDKSIPVLLEIDKFQIDYWKQIVGFEDYGGHFVVAVAYDGEGVYISDECSANPAKYHKVTFKELKEARNSPLFWKPPENSWYSFAFPEKPLELDIMIKRAFERNSRRFLNSRSGEAFTGINGLRVFATDVIEWEGWLNYKVKTTRTEEYVSAFGYQLFKVSKLVHEGGIAGGGNFRPLYIKFLDKSARILGNDQIKYSLELLAKSAGKWKAISDVILENEVKQFEYRNGLTILKEIQSLAYEILEIEEEAFRNLLNVAMA